MTPNPIAQLVAGSVILLAILASVVVLAIHGTITGPEAMGAITTLIALGGGVLAVNVGHKAGASSAAQGFTAGVRAPLPPEGQ